MPDGSPHPMLGCRSTALLYPSSFELLAEHDAAFIRLAESVRYGWEYGHVPLPSILDFGNAIRLADDALDAAQAWKRRPDPVSAPSPSREGWSDYPNAGIKIHRSKSRIVYIAYIDCITRLIEYIKLDTLIKLIVRNYC